MAYFFRPYYKMYKPVTMPTDWFYVENISGSTSYLTIHVENEGGSANPEYSTDGTNWTPLLKQYNVYNFGQDNKIYFRSTSGWNSGEDTGFYFSTEGDIALGGNLGRLVNWQTEPTTVPDYFMYRLFKYNNAPQYVKDVSNLTTGSLRNIGQYSFYQTFYSCVFTTPPDFSSIVNISEGGMSDTFSYNSYLTTGIDLSNVTEVGTSGLSGLYENCLNLSDVNAPNVTEWNTDKTDNWLYYAGTNVQGTKTAHVPAGVTIPQNDSGIPTGWTRVEYQN